MDKEMKVIFKNNIIKFCIGILLLSFCLLYLHKYPAEKIAIFSGFDVIFQKVEILFSNILHKDSASLKSKFDYEKAYQELHTIAEANGCTDPSIPKQITDTLTALHNESSTTLSETLPGYIRTANELRTKIAEQCKKK